MAGRPSSRGRHLLVALLAEAGATFAILYLFLAGWRRDFRVPLTFDRDALEYLMQVKGTIENGWWWVHPRLSAPGVFEQVQYPSNTTVDQAIVWIVHLFTREPGLVINASWMIMVVLSGMITSRCLALLGVSRRVAVPVGLLFALSPYALSRNIDHFSLATYLVPFPCTAALLLASGRLTPTPSDGPRARWVRRALLGGCILVGLNYPYYAFFACFLILVASMMAFAADWNRRELGRGLVFVGVICLATLVNLAPSFYAWADQGKPVSIPEKHAAEAEQYGLKIRQLIGPVGDPVLPPFLYWKHLEDDARYSSENENKTSQLGIVGTLGFFVLLFSFFAPPRVVAGLPEPFVFINAARLTLAALLLATVGGFGSLFNLLISPEIRAYNRVTPFIAFFSLFAIALVADKLLGGGTPSKSLRWAPGALLATLLIGLYDASQVTVPLNRGHEDIRHEWTALAKFVQSLEERLPPGAMVFQLPALTYLNELGREKMLPLDHIKPYLASTRVHWSFPALSDAIVGWQQQVGRLPTPVLVTALVAEGFSAVLIDRHGYFDQGRALLAELGASASSHAVLASDGRYIAVDLGSVPKADVSSDRLPRLGAAAASATAGVPRCDTKTTAYNLEWIGGSSAPFARQPVGVGLSSEFFVAGWAVDELRQSAAGDVDVIASGAGTKVFATLYGVDRPDVSAYLGLPAYRGSGFIVRLAGDEIGGGVHSLSLRILAADRSCYYQTAAVSIVVR